MDEEDYRKKIKKERRECLSQAYVQSKMRGRRRRRKKVTHL